MTMTKEKFLARTLTRRVLLRAGRNSPGHRQARRAVKRRESVCQRRSSRQRRAHAQEPGDVREKISGTPIEDNASRRQAWVNITSRSIQRVSGASVRSNRRAARDRRDMKIGECPRMGRYAFEGVFIRDFGVGR